MSKSDLANIDTAYAVMCAARAEVGDNLHKYIQINVAADQYCNVDTENLQVTLSCVYCTTESGDAEFLVPYEDAAAFARELSDLLRKYKQ